MSQARTDSRSARRALTLALLTVALVAIALTPDRAVAGAPALDDGQPGPGAKWDPGMVLVRFRDGADAQTRAAVARRVGLLGGEALPLIPGLYELRVPAGKKVGDALDELADEPDVVYAEPDEFTEDEAFTTPQDPAYWPNDPHFWPGRYATPTSCKGVSRLAQWPLWPLGKNLTDKREPDALFTPLVEGVRSWRNGGDAALEQYDSINVLPVWNALRDAEGDNVRRTGKSGLTSDGRPVFAFNDIQRAGIAIYDTGLSNHPDIADQVAAVFSTATLLPRRDEALISREFVREVYRDDAGREDVELIEQAGETSVEDANRPLFSLDDTEVLRPDEWKPTDGLGRPTRPNGCDGHGTGVASTAAATTNNARGVAGVAADVPLVGVRVGMPWDAPGSDLAGDDRLGEAMVAWSNDWRDEAERTTENQIQSFAIVRALRVPVFNASLGRGMFDRGRDAKGKPVPVVENPAVAEAYARLFTGGYTLGVVAAGNHRNRYGTGPDAKGAFLYPDRGAGVASLPCGLRLLRTLPVRVKVGERLKRWNPDIDWDRLQMLCVGATTSNESRLADFSGFGPAAVDIAAPGKAIPTAARPGWSSSTELQRDVYVNETGTSFSSPIAAGAASLLRQAAPGAPIAAIRTALLRGARPAPALLGKVASGQLDVACSLDWLAREARRHRADWHVLGTLDAPDFVAATATCSRKRPIRIETTLRIAKSELYGNARRRATFAALLDAKGLDAGEDSNSLAWQRSMLRARGLEPVEGRTIFAIGSPRVERPTGGGAVFDAGTLVLVCTDENFQLSSIAVRFDNAIKPLGWFYPTDTAGPFKGVELGVALDKPWYSGLMPATVKVVARATCTYRPG